MRARLLFIFVGVSCLCLLGFGLYLQHVQNLEPCPLCILQRYAFIAVAAFAICSAVQNPSKWGKRIYAGGMGLISLAGLVVAGRQIWLQHHPQTLNTCGPDLGYMLNSFPLSQALPMLFRGEGDCSKIDWTFLSFSIAQWSALCFAIILCISIYILFNKNPRSGFFRT